MRKSFWIGLPVVLGALLYVGCDSDQATPPTADTAVSDVAASTPSGLKMPDGTQFEEGVENGQPFLRFKLPEGFTLLVRSDGGDPANLEEGDVTCHCSQGTGGCSPFRATYGGRDYIGCRIDPNRCSSCNISLTGDPGSGLRETFSAQGALVLDRRHPVSMVMRRDQVPGRSCATGLLVEDPDIVRQISEAVAPYMGSDPDAIRKASDNPEEFTLRLPMDVYGHLLWVPVSAELIDIPADVDTEDWGSELVWDRYVDEGGETNLEEGGGSCHCDSGSGGCTYHRRGIRGIGTVEWCEASQCDTCTLNF